MKKECRRCFKSKLLSEFYQHKQMFDGYLNVCKECTKKRIDKHREKNIEKIKEYDRNRPNRKERTQKVKERREWLKENDIEKYKTQCLDPKKTWAQNNPEKYRANKIVNNAVRDERLEKPYNCSKCKSTGKIEGHHHDYSKPLEVTWLCTACHTSLHRDLRAIQFDGVG